MHILRIMRGLAFTGGEGGGCLRDAARARDYEKKGSSVSERVPHCSSHTRYDYCSVFCFPVFELSNTSIHSNTSITKQHSRTVVVLMLRVQRHIT